MDDLSKAVSEIARSVVHHDEPVMTRTAPAPQSAPQPEKRSLFDRFRRSQPAPAPQPQAPQAPAQARQPVREEPAAQPRMETRREPTAARGAEDLDIPAFLRRQAN
jgi:cell division protein FtsZ